MSGISFSRNQLEGESIDAYVTDLRNKASRCEFAELEDGFFRDRIVCGVNNDTVTARFLRESELSLEMCIDICRAAEISSAHLKVLTEEKVVHLVNSSEEPDKLAIKKREKEYTREGEGRYEFVSVLWISSQERPSSSVWNNLKWVPQTKLLCVQSIHKRSSYS